MIQMGTLTKFKQQQESSNSISNNEELVYPVCFSMRKGDYFAFFLVVMIEKLIYNEMLSLKLCYSLTSLVKQFSRLLTGKLQHMIGQRKDMNYDKVYLTRKCIGVPGEFGECVTSLSSVTHRKGIGESLRAEMSYGKSRSRVEDTSEPSVLYPSKLK